MYISPLRGPLTDTKSHRTSRTEDILPIVVYQ